jgi:hypothetical protein
MPHAPSMNVLDLSLRVSAQRALLGAIYPDVRLVKVRRDENRITFTAICDPTFSDATREALSIAATEIIADFPYCDLDEQIIGSADLLPKEHILVESWVFQRAEAWAASHHNRTFHCPSANDP